MKRILTCLALCFAITCSVFAQPEIDLEEFASSFTRPVDIAHSGDERLFIVEQRGIIKIADSTGSVLPTPFLDIDARVRSGNNEQGLLGLVFHPDYTTNGYFYVYYTIDDWSSRLSRFEVNAQNPNQADPSSEQILFTVPQPYKNHNAGDLNFGPDGYLYVSLGDGGNGGDPEDRAQNGKTLLGKILRLDVNSGNPYAIPPDNPFVNDTSVLDEVWSLGWRNPWRFSFDPQNGDMWVGDVGQNKYEEISMEPATANGGGNYGWRCLEGFQTFNSTGCGPAASYLPPVFTYAHADGLGKSVTGGYVYRGSDVPDLWGYYLFGDWVSGNMWVTVKDSAGNFTTSMIGQKMGPQECSAFGVDSAGELYVAGLNDGKIYKVVTATASIGPVPPPAFRIGPNPVFDKLNISFIDAVNNPYSLSLYDLQGRLVREIQQIRDPQFVLERESLQSGYYILVLEGDRTFRGKILMMDN